MENILFNIAIMLSLSLFFTLYQYRSIMIPIRHQILIGVLEGVLGLLVLSKPFLLTEGIRFDTRSILLLVSGMFFGWIPTIIAGSIMAVYRIILAGTGLIAGLLIIITSSVIGIVWHHTRFASALENPRTFGLESYGVGLVTQLLILLCLLAVPSQAYPEMYRMVTLPLLLFYPLGTYLLSKLLFSQAFQFLAVSTAEKSAKLFKTMFERAPIGMSLTNLRTGEIENINQSYLDMLGYAKEEVIGHRWAEFSHPEDIEISNQVTERMFAGKEASYTLDKRFLKKDGSIIWANLSLCVFPEECLADISSLCMTIDITKRKLAEQRILYASRHDALTDLYDRGEFERIISTLPLEGNVPMSVVFADMNRLRIINEAFGREQGNWVLKQVAVILQEAFPEQASIFRVGGDEFALLLPNQSFGACEPILDEITEAVSRLKVMDAVVPSISFGICEVNEVSSDLNSAVKLAEKHLATQKLIDSPQMQGKAVYAIINTLHEKNKREEAHSRRVSELSEQLGRAFGLSERSCAELRLVGLLHDIGKIAISEAILNKKGKLNNTEWQEMKRHAEIGFRILNSVEDMNTLALYVLAHHERYNGSGYPKALCGEAIPLQSRMIAIADAYDAMTSERSYRKAVTARTAAKEIKRCAGTQFDPELAKLFVEQVLAISYSEL
ncbi:MAG: HD domain-containing phosphohydrolase [Sphaerochaetaceae bacterium]